MLDVEFIEVFDQESICLLQRAFELACASTKSHTELSHSDLKDVIAEKILVAAQGGERDPLILAIHAMAFTHQYAREVDYRSERSLAVET